MKFRKKPVVIDAMQVPKKWRGQSVPLKLAALVIWLGEGSWTYAADGGIDLPTLEGVMHASPGDWIIRGVKGEIYPCKPDIFDATYDPV